MLGLRRMRPREGRLIEGDRGGREAIEVRGVGHDPPATRPGVALLTCRDIMAEARERLAAKGFDWGDALRTRRRSPTDQPGDEQ